MTLVNYKYLLKEDIIMFGLIKKLFGSKTEETKVEEVPYKVEAPAPTPVAEKASQAVVESIAPAKKKPAPKKAPAKATAKKAPAKKAPKK
jgi:hypothetical protein